jgi:hypothetical protein
MTAPDLPAELKAALEARLQGVSRNEVAARAALISKTYRDGGGSGAIASEADALAYALARMPATYATVTASLNALVGIAPDFAPKILLDIGADCRKSVNHIHSTPATLIMLFSSVTRRRLPLSSRVHLAFNERLVDRVATPSLRDPSLAAASSRRFDFTAIFYRTGASRRVSHSFAFGGDLNSVCE